jgi:hypothetical protein
MSFQETHSKVEALFHCGKLEIALELCSTTLRDATNNNEQAKAPHTRGTIRRPLVEHDEAEKHLARLQNPRQTLCCLLVLREN